MYIFKNAFVSIKRNVGRNLLIGIIIIVISLACSITLAIRNSAKSLIDSYESQYDVVATIGINRENMRGQMQMDKDMSEENREDMMENMMDIFSSASSISASDVEVFGDSELVQNYYYQISVSVNSDDLEAASMSSSSDSNMPSMPGRGPSGKQNFQNMDSGDFTLIGYSEISAMEEFISGTYSITSGEIGEDFNGNSCVINSELASLNALEVGDEITLVDPSDDDNEITLTVVGIYEETSEGADMMGMFTSSANTIITMSEAVNTLTEENEDMKSTLTPSFVLTSKDVIEDFSSELTEKGLSEYLSVSTNLDQVEGATSTISNVSTFATTFLVITLLIGGIVLFVINMINIRERRYEIGVLRTIGMKKSLLSLQFVSELLMVAIVSLFIGAGLGAISSVPVSNYLLESEISNAENEKHEIGNNFGGGFRGEMFEEMNGTRTVQAFDSIDAVVDIKVLLQLLGIGIILTLISSLASMISIQKFSPLTILKERS